MLYSEAATRSSTSTASRPRSDKALKSKGVPQVRRIDRHQPDRGAGRDRRQPGRFVGKKTSGRLEDTIVKTNLEAVEGDRAPRCGCATSAGIIVLDLIDMDDKKNRQKVVSQCGRAGSCARIARRQALQVSDFGLVIITRKRVKQSLERVLTEPCPYCAGTGVIKSSATICYEILTR